MALEQQIQKDIMAAMKAHDYVRTNAVRAIKSAILLAKTSEGGKKELKDADVIKLIQKLIKQRKEAAEQYVAAGRQELADNEMAESAVLEEYVPVEVEEEEVSETEVFTIVEEMPAYPGGDAKLYEYLGKNIKYPQIARESGIQGRVFVNFVVEPDGSVSNVKVMRGIGGGCDEEAVRVIKTMPKWKPGKQRGKAVRVTYTIPVVFKLQ